MLNRRVFGVLATGSTTTTCSASSPARATWSAPAARIRGSTMTDGCGQKRVVRHDDVPPLASTVVWLTSPDLDGALAPMASIARCAWSYHPLMRTAALTALISVLACGDDLRATNPDADSPGPGEPGPSEPDPSEPDPSEPDDAPPIDPGPVVPLDIDVVVGPGGGVQVIAGDAEHPCECGEWEMPRADECHRWGRFREGCRGADCVPLTCLDLSVVQEGQDVPVEPSSFEPNQWAAILPEPAAFTLRIRGCGFDDTLAVPFGPFPPSTTLTEIRGDISSNRLLASWSTAAADSAVIECWSPMLGAISCLGGEGEAELPSLCPPGDITFFQFRSHNGGAAQPIQGGLGTLRLWHEGPLYRTALHAPDDTGLLRQSLRTPISIQASSGTVQVEEIRLSIDFAAGPGSLREANFWDRAPTVSNPPRLQYVAGDDVDSLTWREGDESCVGTMPHLTPEVPIDVGDPDGSVLEMTFPPTTLECTDGRDVTLSFQLALDVGVIARPL